MVSQETSIDPALTVVPVDEDTIVDFTVYIYIYICICIFMCIYIYIGTCIVPELQFLPASS